MSTRALRLTLGSLLLVSGLLGAARGLVVTCLGTGSQNPSSTSSYCNCSKLNTVIKIKCDFRRREDVVLTKELLAPFVNPSPTSAYVRMVNATSVHVTGEFLQTWLDVPSAAFDVWNSGKVVLESTARRDNTTIEKASTFAGVGIVGCHVPEVPPMFLRDKMRGAFRIKQSTVGVIRAGFLHNISEMRYIVMRDTTVQEVEGSVATEGCVTLSQLEVHKWNGLILSNVTIQTLGAGAFNLTHEDDLEIVEVQGCYAGRVGTGALTVSGHVQVTISDNIFHGMERSAFKLNVSGGVLFQRNMMFSETLDAMEGVACHNSSSLQNNTIYVDSPYPVAPNGSTSPLQDSCSSPQLFLVVSRPRFLRVLEDTRAAWALGVAVVVLAVIMLVWIAFTFWKNRSIMAVLNSDSRSWFPVLFKGPEKTSQENLPKNIEQSTPREEDPEEGSSGVTVEACEAHDFLDEEPPNEANEELCDAEAEDSRENDKSGECSYFLGEDLG